MRFHDGTLIQVGDRVQFGTSPAVVETIIEGDEVRAWGLQEAGFMLLCEQFGRVFIVPGDSDWEDVEPARPA